MRTRGFEWEGAAATATAVRAWAAEATPQVDVAPIERGGLEGGDAAGLRLTAGFDATERAPDSLQVDPDLAGAALRTLEPPLREALELAATNIQKVAEAQPDGAAAVELSQGQLVTLREVA